MEKISKFIKTQIADKVVSSSLVMIIGGFLGSSTNYLYHLATARMLGPTDYGILDSLISLIYQLLIPLATLALVVTKYVSSFKGQNRLKTIESFFWKLNKKLLFFLPLFFIGTLAITPLVTNFLYLPSPFLFIVIGLSFSLGIISTVARSFLQGLGRFTHLSFLGISEGVLRLILTIFLLVLGLGLFGAIFPFLITAIFSVLLSLFLVRDLIKGERNEPIPEKREIIMFTLPVFLINLGTTSLISSDVILARHFLSPFDAGLYSALSTLGKIIFFAAVPVIGVIFPIISETQAAKKNINQVVLKGGIIIGSIITASFLIFTLAPKLMVLLLFGEKFLNMIPYVTAIAIVMSLYTVNFTLLNVFLALKITQPTIFVCLTALLQITLIFFFHESIQQLIIISITVFSLLLITLLIYYGYDRYKSTNYRSSERK